jgi:hypothetical protein
MALSKSIVQGRDFKHAIYERPTYKVDEKELHVYIGSDGTPWDRNRPATDPTPRNPLALRLMLADPARAIYVGRPCYHGTGSSMKCASDAWTSARYSEQVIASVSMVIENYVEEHQVERVVLIGYSGGGAIAALLAARLSRVSTLITIAANLDTSAWTTAHSYKPLLGSLNPANADPVPEDIRQFHLYGTLDTNVPHATTLAFLALNSSAEVIEYANFTHICCWESVWSDDLFKLLGKPDD